MSRNRAGRSKEQHSVRSAQVLAVAIGVAGALIPGASFADEGGVSFWLPGLYGSLAAVPATAGWSFLMFQYHTSVNAGADVSAAREITIGRFNPTLNLNLKADLNSDAEIVCGSIPTTRSRLPS
jgi:hypothetical protein